MKCKFVAVALWLSLFASAAAQDGAQRLRDAGFGFSSGGSRIGLLFPGVGSGATNVAQSGTTRVVTTDADGVFGSISATEFAQRFAVVGPQGPAGPAGPSSEALAQISQILASVRRDSRAISEGIALASAFTVLPPNPGDRFALTVGGAAFDGRGAVSITATARLTGDLMVFGGYARSENQDLVKAGASFSFR